MLKPFLTANWQYLAMLNFRIDPDVLAPFVPSGTELDFHNGETYVSVVGFLFYHTLVLGLPIPRHRNFEEVNLRFYVRKKSRDTWRRGVVVAPLAAPPVPASSRTVRSSPCIGVRTMPTCTLPERLVRLSTMPRVVHFEIHAGDPDRAIAFYQALFGWTFTKFEGGPMPYWVVKTGDDGMGIDGGLHPRRGNGNTDVDEVIGYVCTINVPDLDDYLSRATAAGAVLCVPKFAVPHVGLLAYCKDTEGNVFGMLQPQHASTSAAAGD